MSEKMADDFLMSPMVDYCFKELLAYPTVRKGFLAAIRDPIRNWKHRIIADDFGKRNRRGEIWYFGCADPDEGRLSD